MNISLSKLTIALLAPLVFTSAPVRAADFDLAKHEKATQAAMKGPQNWVGPTDKLLPPKDIKLAIIACDMTLAGCSVSAEAAAEAAKTLGWKVDIYDGRSDFATQNRLITQAVATGANAILADSINPELVKTGIAAAHAKGVIIGGIFVGSGVGKDGYAFDIGPNWKKIGEAQGDWIISSSKGKAITLPLNDLEFSTVVTLVNSSVETLKKCPDCKTLDQETFVAGDIGNGLGRRVLGLLQRNPEVSYLYGTYDPAIADMVPSIMNAGLGDKVKIVGQVGNPENLKYIKEGKAQAATVALDATYAGWMAVDATIRMLTNVPLMKSRITDDPDFLYSGDCPFILYTKDNLPADLEKPWEAPINTRANFKKLWGVEG
ncbi:sugar ABC transporter substrate-binding protein [Ochrobactrum sp. Q0168]|uniref:sugar ABC transporter substrate-binding protein n=1 Tax=Ochrobactrum sp. Q0168 TaxID=2793241 RepID=UPI0018EA8F53|nr:sugar ABC transporter substrate-binding protein [Ochrobactrum sp. Q0168]